MDKSHFNTFEAKNAHLGLIGRLNGALPVHGERRTKELQEAVSFLIGEESLRA